MGVGNRGPFGPRNHIQGKLNAIEQQDVKTGTLRLVQLDAKVLIDPGASHSYIAQNFDRKLDLPSMSLPYTPEVNTPLGESWLVQTIFKDCPIMIGSETLPVDLVPLPLNDFEVILGMDWLAKYYATIDYREKVVTFKIRKQMEFSFVGNKPFFTIGLISVIKAIKLLKRGSLEYIACVIEKPPME